LGTPILRLENVNKTLSDYFCLKNINMDLNAGEVHALIGENGSGKTSLMNIIAGNCFKDSGSIYLDGNPIQINSALDAQKYGITITHQEPVLFDNLTVAENIFFGTDLYLNTSLKLVNRYKIQDDCRKLLKKLNINMDYLKLVKNIGAAHRQMVEICRAFVSKSRIILMDEPTSSFTESEVELLFQIIRQLKAAGISIIYISHKLEEVKKICDRISVLRDGEIVGTHYVSDIEMPKLITMMSGFDIKHRYPKLSLKPGKEVFRVTGLSAGNTLKNISFSLKKREIIGITGLAGSGRSKIAKSIFGVEKFHAGEILINGRKVSIKSPVDAIREGIGYVPEDRQYEGLFMYLKIFENISAASFSQRSDVSIIDLGDEKHVASTYVDRLGIKIGNIYNSAKNLSGGNQQKVILAKWLMSESKIFILDEPTRGIDVASKVDVYNLMNELVIKGASIILISSDIDELLGMCDRTLVLFQGEITAVIPRSEATQENVLYYATGGKKKDN